MEAARARRGYTGAAGPSEHGADPGDSADLRHQDSASKQRRQRRGKTSATAGDFCSWVIVLGLLAIAALLYLSDPGTKIAEWRLRRRHLQDGIKEHQPLPSLEEDTEVLAVFSKLVNEEEELGEIVHSFEEGVEKFEEFGKELDEEKEKRKLTEEVQDVKSQERGFALKESLEAEEHKEQEALESMYLNSKNAKQVADEEAMEARRESHKHSNSSYTIIQILQAASSPLPMRFHVNEDGDTEDPVETSVAFSTTVTAPEDGVTSSIALKNPSLIQWSPLDENEPVLVAVWQGASTAYSKEGSDGQPLMFSYSSDEGNNWQEPLHILQLPFSALWSPQLFVNDDNELMLFFTRSRMCPKKTFKGRIWTPGGDIMVMSKPQLHAPWEEPREIVTQTSSSPPYQLSGKPVGSASALVLPFWTEHLAGSPVCTSGSEGSIFREDSSKERWKSSAGIIFSSDGGATWSIRGRVDNVGVPLMGGSLVQMRVMKSLEGMVGHSELMMFLYSETGAVFRATSFDLGKTWRTPQLLQLPNPASRITVMPFKDSEILVMAFNNHPKTANKRSGPCKSCITRLSLAMSRDRGLTWNLMGAVDETAQNEVIVAGPSLEQVSQTELGILYYKHGPDSGYGDETDPGIFFSRIDAWNLNDFPWKDDPPSAKLTDAGKRKVIGHYLSRQSHSVILRMNIQRPSWSDLAEELFQKYLFPGYPSAGAVANAMDIRRTFFRALEREAKAQGGDHLSKDRKERLSKIHRNSNEGAFGADASGALGEVDLSVVNEGAARDGVSSHHGKHRKHRLDLGGDEADEEDELPLVAAPPLPQHSLHDVVKQDVDPATLCVNMPCCRDYGPNCAHIPHCDAELCASRPCCGTQQ